MIFVVLDATFDMATVHSLREVYLTSRGATAHSRGDVATIQLGTNTDVRL